MSVLSALITLFIFGAFLSALVRTVPALAKQFEPKKWPSVRGQITSSHIAPRRAQRQTVYELNVRYAYTVNGTKFEGERIAYGHRQQGRRSYQHAYFEALPKGIAVTVRYDPQDPNRSVLGFGIEPYTASIIVFFAFFAGLFFNTALISPLQALGVGFNGAPHIVELLWAALGIVTVTFFVLLDTSWILRTIERFDKDGNKLPPAGPIIRWRFRRPDSPL